MSRVFDPNTNPYADDLLRLALAPKSRFSPRERRIMGHILAGKLYGLRPLGRDWHFPYRGVMYFREGTRGRDVAIALYFYDENEGWYLEMMAERVAYMDAAVQMIIIGVGSSRVIELYNGPMGPAASSSIRNLSNHLPQEDDAPRAQTEGGFHPRSDAALTRDYLGHDRGGGGEDGGGRGGDGGGNDGVPPGGEGGSSGAGGVGELLNHPVLFSIERRHFDAILRQV